MVPGRHVFHHCRIFILVMTGVAIAWVPVVKETQGGQVGWLLSLSLSLSVSLPLSRSPPLSLSFSLSLPPLSRSPLSLSVYRNLVLSFVRSLIANVFYAVSFVVR